MLAGVENKIMGASARQGAWPCRSSGAVGETDDYGHTPQDMTPCEFLYSTENKPLFQKMGKNKAKNFCILLIRKDKTDYGMVRIALNDWELHFIRFLSRRNRNSHA
jgi:hypothetical protein